MKKHITFLLVAVSALFFWSCDRSGIFEEFDHSIDWELHIVAVTDDNNTQTVTGATVEIYTTAEDRDAKRNLFLSGTTGTNGEVIFTLSDFDKKSAGAETVKGIYYLRVFKGDLSKNDLTRYLLMNSGANYKWVKIE